MYSPKVIVTKQKVMPIEYIFENEIGLSTYDLALISTNKIIKNGTSYSNKSSENTYLI